MRTRVAKCEMLSAWFSLAKLRARSFGVAIILTLVPITAHKLMSAVPVSTPAYRPAAASSTSQLRKATIWGRFLREGGTVIQ